MMGKIGNKFLYYEILDKNTLRVEQESIKTSFRSSRCRFDHFFPRKLLVIPIISSLRKILLIQKVDFLSDL